MKKIKVVGRIPGEVPEIVEGDNDLSGMRALIGGGHLELVQINTDAGMLDLWCDEEGKLKSLTPNIAWRGDIVCGPVFVATHDSEGETVGLDPNQARAALAYLFSAALW